MTVANVIRQLFEDGRLVLQTDQRPTLGEICKGVDVVVEFEPVFRQTLALTPPDIAQDAVSWSVEQFYLIAQRVAYQHLDQNRIEFHFDAPPADALYSVDLLFRFLPDLLRLSQSTDVNASLTERLMNLATDWPLSSVGIALSAEPEVQAILDCRSLRILYVDRIIAAGDVDRLSHSEIRNDVRAAIGANPQLSPKLSECLLTTFQNETDET
ncbi:hypothetical protein [Thalassoglobus polymorphus]|uniref:MoxR-vWA-beta-propeller ternary system domain-containing protein n=1 Tax=Thalassoglobus polymorphus TaxID=2527994 RepID=A0A517QKN6_9PLAN|nr:hypothetical protein [Thalassoglobus polymorphus]QDT32154.1 hypothetical protein Mal48_13960 [Thalassoglobus polymorphus]